MCAFSCRVDQSLCSISSNEDSIPPDRSSPPLLAVKAENWQNERDTWICRLGWKERRTTNSDLYKSQIEGEQIGADAFSPAPTDLLPPRAGSPFILKIFLIRSLDFTFFFPRNGCGIFKIIKIFQKFKFFGLYSICYFKFFIELN